MKEPLSPQVEADIRQMTADAMRLRTDVTSRYLQRRLDLVLADLDEIPRLFEAQRYVVEALDVPRAQLAYVAAVVAKFGLNAVVRPDTP